jgi:hypothetical protein
MPGQSHDITSFDALMAGIYCLALIGDKAFDAHWLREVLRGRNIEAVIPLREVQMAPPHRKLFLSHQSVSARCHALRKDRQMLRRDGEPRRHRSLGTVNVNRP